MRIAMYLPAPMKRSEWSDDIAFTDYGVHLSPLQGREMREILVAEREANSVRTLLGIQDGKPVGFIRYGSLQSALGDTLIEDVDPEYQWAEWCADGEPLQNATIDALYVQPSERGKGVGRLLVTAALLDMSRAGATQVRTQVWDNNKGSVQRLQDDFGFVVSMQLDGERIVRLDLAPETSRLASEFEVLRDRLSVSDKDLGPL
jgi:ribosomal protein S18 acetylase RimI-like enzyme